MASSHHLFFNLSFLLLLISFFLTTHLNSAAIITMNNNNNNNTLIQSPHDSNGSCNPLHYYESFEAKCTYLSSDPQCHPEGYINYLYLFYCLSGRHPLIGYLILSIWLMVLFYLLGNTAANYFCSNLEALSSLLNLSPSLAGVTLLSLGNGAPDVFSTIVSFLGTSSGDVGLNGVLGGAFFVSSVVVGTISICVGPRKIAIDRSNFIRDISFLILVLSILIIILIIGEINMWSAMAFTSLYGVYALIVSITTNFNEKVGESESDFLALPTSKDEAGVSKGFLEVNSIASRFIYLIELPLYLPRRITIPDVCKKRWSKIYAILSVVLAPILLATIWDSKRGQLGSEESWVIYGFGVISGMILGIVVLVKTKKECPPKSFLLPWLAGGFLMSVVWTYIIAEELVSLLVSIGTLLGISPSILGLTVLAWGNSIGDMIANVAVARNGGPGGAQVAMSGCYGGPIFNVLMGLGVSLVCSSWGVYPSLFDIPKDPSLFVTLGFLIGGLLWTVVILPRRGMVVDRVLGCGLLAIYLCFLSLRLAESLGFLQLQ